MADGTKYDKNKFTCAHKNYPFGTLLRVTNISNGKSVIVEVRDRGPYARGRIVDLSYSAAEALGMVRAGVALVEIEVIPENSIPLFFDVNNGFQDMEMLMPHEFMIPIVDYPNLSGKPADKDILHKSTKKEPKNTKVYSKQKKVPVNKSTAPKRHTVKTNKNKK